MKKRLFALMAGLLLIAITSPAFAEGHNGITQGPLAGGRTAVMLEAGRLGMSENPAFVSAVQRLDAITGRYSYDMGFVYECQTPTPNALQVMQDRIDAFSAINAAIAVLQSADSSMQFLAPVNGVSHVEAIVAVEDTWPKIIQATAADVLQAAGIAAQVDQLRALEAQHGTLSFEWGTPNHWAIQHPAAREIREVHEKLEAHFEHLRHQQQQQFLYKLLGTMGLILLLGIGTWLKAGRPSLAYPRRDAIAA